MLGTPAHRGKYVYLIDTMAQVPAARSHINFDVNTKTQTFTESADGNHYVMYRSFPSDVDYYEAKLRNILEKRPFLAEKPRVFRVGT